MNTVKILDCNGSTVSFKDLSQGENYLFKSDPILKCNLKIPLIYLFKRISEEIDISEESLSLKVDNHFDGQSCVLTLSNRRGVTLPAASFTYHDVYRSTFVVSGNPNDKDNIDNDSDDDDIEIVQEENMPPYKIIETILIYYDNQYITVRGEAAVTGLWRYIIVLYRLLFSKRTILYLFVSLVVYFYYFWADADMKKNVQGFIHQVIDIVVVYLNSYSDSSSAFLNGEKEMKRNEQE